MANNRWSVHNQILERHRTLAAYLYNCPDFHQVLYFNQVCGTPQILLIITYDFLKES